MIIIYVFDLIRRLKRVNQLYIAVVTSRTYMVCVCVISYGKHSREFIGLIHNVEVFSIAIEKIIVIIYKGRDTIYKHVPIYYTIYIYIINIL